MIQNYSDIETDEDSDDEVPKLNREQLGYRITSLTYDLSKMKKENERLLKENQNLRDAMAIMNGIEITTLLL